MRQRQLAWVVPAALLVGVVLNFWLFGPLGALFMVGIEFTPLVLVALVVLVVRHRHDEM